MAIYDDLNENRIPDTQTAWENKSGKQVEDFISRSIRDLNTRDKEKDVSRMLYDSATQTLTLYNESGGEIASETVSVAVPNYNHNLVIEQVLIDDVPQSDKLLCKLGSKISLRVKYSLTAENPLTGKLNHIQGKLKLFINLGLGGYQEIETGIVSLAESQEIDISKYFTKTTISKINLKVVTAAGVPEEIKTVLATTTKEILVLNPIISYSEDYIINGFTSFDVVEGGGLKYKVRYTVTNDTETSSQIRSEDLNINLTTPGLNIIKAFVALSDNESITSNTITILLINTKDLINKSILCAVNEIADTIVNWEYSKLYKLTLYTKNVNDESVIINTKLTNTADSEDAYFNKVKEISLIGNSSDNITEEISYFFGIEALSNLNANLIVNVNNKQIIKFEDAIQINISSDSSFTYTKGYTYSFDQFDPDNSNIITKEVLLNIETPDGLVQDNNLTAFRVSAKDYSTSVLNKNLKSELTNSGFTFELDFKSYNISDPNKPILKLGRFVLYPTELNWQFLESDSEEIDRSARSSLFQEDVRTHLLIEVVPNFKVAKREIPSLMNAVEGKTINIVRVFINGCIDREFKYINLEDFYIQNEFNLDLKPSSADIDIYSLRVYNRDLTFLEVLNNYISTISNINRKINLKDSNDIVATDLNNDTYISYNKTKDKYNTLLFIMPKGKQYPHQFNCIKGLKIPNCTVFINYNNNNNLSYKYDEKTLKKCSGRFTSVEVSGQGTSAMKYYWYNIAMKKSIFTSDGCYNLVTQLYESPTEDSGMLYNSKYYYMPSDTTNQIGVTKICGKTNYASSMQSHKLGATRAYHDLWDTCVNKDTYTVKDEIKGRKAVLEEPFIVFYFESDLEDVSKLTPSDVSAIDDTQIKFASFQTWGSAKGDKQTFGYDEEKSPQYLLMEGAENNGILCNFLAPWMPDCIVLDDETYKTKALEVEQTDLGVSYKYNLKDSWDVDFGLKDGDKNSLSEQATLTLNKFIESYNFIYLHTINLEPYKESYSINDSRNLNVLDTTKKYYITNSRYADNIYFPGKLWDVFRYDLYSNIWVPAGLPIMAEDGIHLKPHSTIKSVNGEAVFDYEVFNLKAKYTEWGGVENESIENFKSLFIKHFKLNFGKYYHVEDVTYHQAFIKLFAGTDNRAKNTYFKMYDANSKVQLLQDDVDTLLATDNRGLLNKPYYLLEPSLDKETADMWGGKSAFFELFDIAYQNEIVQMLKTILSKFNIIQEYNIQDWMQKYFYFVLDYYPAVTYNYTARMAYESAQVFFDYKDQNTVWGNNGQAPISQSHGSCVESEREFMKKRLVMFLSLVQISNIFGREGTGITIKSDELGSSASQGSYNVDITPYQYLYLGYNIGSTPGLFSGNVQKTNVPYLATITLLTFTPSYYVLGNNYIKKFDNFSKIHYVKGYSLSAKRLIEMVAYDPKVPNSPFKPSTLDLNTPVLTKLDLRQVKSLSTIDLSSSHTPKLKEVYLTGTSISNVVLPTGSRLETIHFPATLNSLSIYNNPGLKDVQFESLDNIITVDINCSKCGNFDVKDFCNRISNNINLQNITLRNLLNLQLTEEVLSNLLKAKCTFTGSINIVNEKGELKEISFQTLLVLVNKFGNIKSPTNPIRFNYKETEVSEVNTSSEVSIFKSEESQDEPEVFGNPFNISIPYGNNIKILDEPNPYNPDVTGRLDISYSLSCSSSIATINNKGDITLYKESVEPAKATITLTTSNSHKFVKLVIINFKWKAPQIGDFAYADGTFSKFFNSSKTLVGLVYAKKAESDIAENGTVYIIGVERMLEDKKGYKLGYSADGIEQSEFTELTLVYKVQNYVKTILQRENYDAISGISSVNVSSLDSIKLDTYTSDDNSNFKGNEDTLQYINHVNSILLKKLYESPDCREWSHLYISRKQLESTTSYYIESLDNLDKLIANIPKAYFNTTYMDSLLYPYFYGMHLYEPKVLPNEKLNSKYSKGHWYAPNVSQLARIFYYRGLSASGSNFIVADDVNKPIISNPSLSNISTRPESLKIPIFSNAFDLITKANGTFPAAWNSIAGVDNTTTSVGSDVTGVSGTSTFLNYSYQKIQNSFDGTGGITYINLWVLGAFNRSYYSPEKYKAAWRYTEHRGVPFTEFEFSKNNK